MQEVWFKGSKNKEERESIQQDFALAHRAFRRLEEILEGKKKNNPRNYDVANWAYEQADTNGYNRAIAEVLNLIQERDD